MGRTYLGRYEIDREIGRGGMAVVYRGIDTTLNRPVAVKVMHSHLLKRQDARERFCREARVIAKLKHENIVEVYDYSGNLPAGAAPDSEDALIVTELVEGISLAEYLVMHGPMIPEVAAMVTAVVAGALEHAHSNGVVHRDVKPENIMVGVGGVLKLMDFGIAHVVDMEHLTVTGAIVGSPAHMSPEQVDGKALDARTDVFSLGTLFFLLSSGSLPFNSDTPSGLLRAISEARVPDIRGRVKGFPDDLWVILSRMMARDADRRFQSAGEVAESITGVLSSVGIGPLPEEMRRFFSVPAVQSVEMRHRVCQGRVALGRRYLAAGRQALAIREADTAIQVLPESEEAVRLMSAVRKSVKRVRLIRIAFFVGVIGLLSAGALFVMSRQRRFPGEVEPVNFSAAISLQRQAAFEMRPSRRGLDGVISARTRPLVRVRPYGAPATQPPSDVPVQAERSAPLPEMFPLSIHAYPPAVQIQVDGRRVGTGRVEGLMLEPGRHRLVLSHPSCDQCRDVDTSFVIDRASPPRAPMRVSIDYREARLLVVGPQNGKVFVNNEARPRGVTNQPIMIPMDRPTPVDFMLKVVVDGRPDFSTRVSLQAGKAAAVRLP